MTQRPVGRQVVIVANLEPAEIERQMAAFKAAKKKV